MPYLYPNNCRFLVELFLQRQRYEHPVSANVEEHDVIIDGEEMNVSSTTDTTCTNVTLDPVVESDSRPKQM